MLEISISGLEAVQARLDAIGQDAPVAQMRAVNRTKTSVRVQMLRTISGLSGVAQNRIERSIRETDATREDPVASVVLYAGRVALARWGSAHQKAHMEPSDFWATMPSGHRGIFYRAPGARARRIRPGRWHTLPIRERYGPRWTEVLGPGEQADLTAFATETLEKNMHHELDWLLRERSGAA